MKKKKVLKIVLISAVSLLVVAGIVFGVFMFTNIKNAERWAKILEQIENTPDEDVLDYFNSESSFEYDMSDFKKNLDKANENQASLVSEAIEWMEDIREVPDDYMEIYKEANEGIAEFFYEEYGVSVEDKLAVYKVVQIDIPSQYEIGGFYAYGDDVDGKTIYINSDTFELPADDLTEDGIAGVLNTYIHETVHYLGFNSPNNEDLSLIMEGFTAALTIDILEYMGYDIPGGADTAYLLNQRMVRQLMMANEDIVGLVVSSDGKGDTLLYEELCDVLGKEKASDYCEINIILDYYFTSPQFSGDEEMLYVGQYLTAEYCKSFDLTDEEILEIHKYFIAPVAEI